MPDMPAPTTRTSKCSRLPAQAVMFSQPRFEENEGSANEKRKREREYARACVCERECVWQRGGGRERYKRERYSCCVRRSGTKRCVRRAIYIPQHPQPLKQSPLSSFLDRSSPHSLSVSSEKNHVSDSCSIRSEENDRSCRRSRRRELS